MSIATSEAIAATQQAVLMAAGLQSKPDWKGFAVAAFNGAAGTTVKANLGDGMIASNTYIGLTVTGDMLIRGEHVNADVLSATMAGSMVGNYAGQKGLEYVKRQPEMSKLHNNAEAKTERTSAAVNDRDAVGQRNVANYHKQSIHQARPVTAHEKRMMAEEGDVAQYPSDPVLDVSEASYKLSEMNRTRMKRWNTQKPPRSGSATAELLRAAQVASGGVPYSALNNASTIEKAVIYGAGAGLALAALPEAAAGVAISFTATAFESLGYASMASVGIPVAENMLVSEVATIVGGSATLVGGASIAGRAYNSAARFFRRSGAEKSGSLLFRTSPTSSALNEGLAPITGDLVNAMRNKGRSIDIAVKGSDDYRYLKSMGAEGSTNTATPNHILIREDASKSTLLEKFLHGTQNKLGIVNRLSSQGAEIHVKDFMIRHAKLLGLDNVADLRLLQQLKLEEIERFNMMYK